MKFIKLLILSSLLSYININAQWSTNYMDNLQLTNWSRLPLSAASDGKGGVYISINKDIPNSSSDAVTYAYLFNVDKFGYPKWNEPIRIGIGDWQSKVELIEDGFGGVIAVISDLDVTWDGSYRLLDYKIRVQRIDSMGNKLWGDGILVSTDTTDQYEFDICTDGNGGCYVSWLSEKTMDYITSDGYRAIQHISAQGERMWSDTGKVVYKGSVANISKDEITIIADNEGGFYGINTSNLKDYFLVHLSNKGETLFETVSRIGSWITCIKMTDDKNLLVVANLWDTYFNYVSIKMDKLDTNGKYNWELPILFADSVGGKSSVIDIGFNNDSSASILWNDQNLNGQFNGMYFQKVSKNGELQLPDNGINPLPGDVGGSAMLKSYDDYLCISGNDVQKVTTNGDKLFGENGKQFSMRTANYDGFVSDTRGGFIKVWIEGLSGLWAQQVSSNGNLGEVITNISFPTASIPFNFELSQNYPNPFNPNTIINYEIPSKTFVTLKVYDVLGNEVAVLVNEWKETGSYTAQFSTSGKQLPSGVYFYQLRAGNFTETKKCILLK